MKNILIIGAAKSGKSTLGNMICNHYKYNKIPLDYFTSSLKHNFKELGISSNVVIERQTSKKLSLLLSRVISIIDQEEGKYIIDSAHLYLEDIIPYIDKTKWEIFCLGYPNISPQEKLNQIRKYETKNDWTYNNSDEDLLNKLEKLVDISKELENECIDLKIKFIDTSENLEEKIEETFSEFKKLI